MSARSKRNSPRRRIFGLALTAIGVALAIPFGYRVMTSALESAGWPHADGTIRDSQLITQEQRDGSFVYRLHIVYAYTAQGIEYQSGRIRFGSEDSASPNREQAERWLEEYPPGRVVTVYYDPQSPSNSVLEPGAHVDAYALLALGVFLMVAGGVLARV